MEESRPQSPNKAGRSAKLGLSSARVYSPPGPHRRRLEEGPAVGTASPTLHTKRQAAREAGTGGSIYRVPLGVHRRGSKGGGWLPRGSRASGTRVQEVQ